MPQAVPVPSVYQFLDAREFLKQAYAARKRAQPAFSQRFIAQALGAKSSSVFRQLLEGKSRLTGARVLIVENDPATADALARLLRNWDAAVSAHRDLAGVTDHVAAGHAPPDVLILDYHLDNGACGLDVATYLRGVTGSALPVIVTTADHAPEIAAEVAALGAELMHKPIKPAQLRALLSHLLR